MKEKCLGCGAFLQTTNPNAKGYINKEVYEKRQGDCYCERCFTLRHYKQNREYPFDHEAYQQNLNKIARDKGLIVYVVDLFDLEGSLMPNINQLFQTNDILVVLNKVDLYLNSLNIHKIETYIRQYLKQKKIKYLDLQIISSFKPSHIISLVEKIKEYRNHRNVYFVGMTNVGKSSIINQIIKHFTKQNDLITVSNLMNTTLDNIYIPFDDKSYLVDTPGLINPRHLMMFIDKETLDIITPKNYIRPKTFQLEPEQTLFIVGFLRIDFVFGSKSSFVTNFRNDLLIHRTKRENADMFYEEHVDDILKIPHPDERKKLGGLKTIEVDFDLNEKKDIVISGMGFVSVYGFGHLTLKTFKNVDIVIRKAIL